MDIGAQRQRAVGWSGWLDLLASKKLAYVISSPVMKDVQVGAE